MARRRSSGCVALMSIRFMMRFLQCFADSSGAADLIHRDGLRGLLPTVSKPIQQALQEL
jgi:hypothetical protein